MAVESRNRRFQLNYPESYHTTIENRPFQSWEMLSLNQLWRNDSPNDPLNVMHSHAWDNAFFRSQSDMC
jgi:hypothetical protein